MDTCSPKSGHTRAPRRRAYASVAATQSKVPGLAPALPGERVMCGDVCCYVDGHGPPLLLVHTINAVSSAAEMRPLYEHYRASHTVFCPDLPGFGLSTRSDREYSPRLFTDAVHMVATLARERCGNQPIDAVAASLGCEFLARAAVEHPAAWGRLAFVSPTGLSGTGKRRGATGSTRAIPGMHRLLSVPLWANALYRNLTRPAVIRYFLGRTWGGKAIDETLWAYGVQTARQPGARFAPLYFLSGGLFSADIHRIYEALAQPVWMSHGTRGDFSDFRGLSRLHDPGRWQRTVFQTGALPYFEQPAAFCAAFDAFLADNTPPSTAAPN